jgi:hypothetical protein
MCAIAGSAFAQVPTVVDFEKFVFLAESGNARHTRTVTDGPVTFSGGSLVAGAIQVVADQTIVYANLAPDHSFPGCPFCTVEGCNDCSPTVTMKFKDPVDEVSFDLLNGYNGLFSYLIDDDLGHHQEYTLLPSTSGGIVRVELPYSGVKEVRVTFVPPLPAADPTYRVIVDNVNFYERTIVLDPPSDSPQKVLIHETAGGPFLSTLQTTDREIKITATLKTGTTSPAGVTGYFRVLDPPDRSVYIPVANQTANDNRDNNDTTSGRLTGAGVVQVSGSPGVIQATADMNGVVRLTLTSTDQEAGDNYQIEASFDSNFSCAQNCWRSGIITAWKRVYVERDSMYRQGAQLAADAGAGQNIVRVRQSPFRRGDTIRLIHAPYRDGTGPIDATGAINLGYWSELAVIDRVANDRAADNRGGDILTLVGTLQNSYGVDRSGFSNGALDYLNDGAVRETPPPNQFETNTSYLAGAFAPAFVEYVLLDAIANPHVSIPFIDQLTAGQLALFAGKWVENADHTASPTGGVRFPPMALNHQYLIGAASHLNVNVVLGSTFNGNRANFSFIWLDTLERGCSVRNFARNQQLLIFGLNPANVNGETVVHEIAHQWDVNPPEATTGGHCNQTVYPTHPTPTAGCIMHAVSDANANDNVAAFHYVNNAGVVDSEYITIRSAPDPLP